MKCTRCQHENPPQAKFCLECGARLTLTCSRCGTELPPEAKFCLECGEPLRPGAIPPQLSPGNYTPKHLAEKILSSKNALEGERKQVSVLFVDVSGFTSLSERLDPEDVHGLMKRAFDLMLSEVHRYEGTVNQFLGDGIMALFGAPIAHEDHAHRACYAALYLTETLGLYARELRRQRGLSFTVRIGLNSGEVVVGGVGDDMHMEYTAIGHTVGLAARMEQLAEPGRVYMTQ